MLAAEYALSLLEPAEADAFEARLAAEPELRAIYAAWVEDFAEIAEALPDVAPPMRMYQSIEARLFPESRRSLLERLGVFQAVLAAALAAVVLIVVLRFVPGTPEPEPTGPVYVAELAAEAQGFVAIASYAAGASELELTLTGEEAPAGSSFELWLIVGDNPPASLGLLPRTQRGTLVLNAAQQAAIPGATLAVSIEPEGGSPTGAPTGDVVALAEVTEL